MASFSGKIFVPKYKAKENVQETRTIGFEFEGKYDISHWNAQGYFKKKEILDKHPGFVDGGSDGGCNCYELVTHPESIGWLKAGGSKNFRDALDFLAKEMKPEASCGTHIHISRLSTDAYDTFNNIYWLCAIYGPELQKIFGRITSWAPLPLVDSMGYGQEILASKDVATRLYSREMQNATNSKHAFVNRKTGVATYEFRGPKSSNNINEVIAWAQVCYNIVETAADQNKMQNAPLSSLLKGAYIRKYVKLLDQTSERKLDKALLRKRISSIKTIHYKSENTNKILK